MSTRLVMGGRSLARVMVPATLKVMPEYCPAGALLAAVSAARSEPVPLSLRLVTV